ncbi:coiled-coil domain-containing protein mad1 [Massospora cicadina]|nr:coiled-coil domain-containing protein mad1 [Massospora cicadina]
MVANKTIETNSLEKPTKECQEMLQTLRRAMLLLVKKLLKEKDELQQNLSPLDIEAYDKSELAKELIKWKTKAETLDETLRNAAMDYHFELPYRILQLKDNPASVDLRIKKSHLDRLRLENNRLLKLTQGIPSLKGLVPAESLENALKEIEELRAEKESNEEKTSRLNGVLRAKTLDFKRTIVSVLGYDIEVLGSTLVKIRPQGQPYHFILKFTNDVDKSLANFQIQGDADMDMITPSVTCISGSMVRCLDS